MPAPATFNPKSYQAPCAGKARALADEVDQDYERRAKVATPAGYFQVYGHGGKAQPTTDVEKMTDEGMGKKPSGVYVPGSIGTYGVPGIGVDTVRKPLMSAYNPSSNGASNAAGI